MTIVYIVTLVVAACSLLYELLLAQVLSELLGATVLRYSLTIGCYLGALGLGAWLCRTPSHESLQRLVRIELALSALGGLAVPLVYFLDAAQRHFFAVAEGPLYHTPWPARIFLVASHGVIVAIGLLSGFEVPLLLAHGERRRPGSTNAVLGVDYLGALAASVAFPLVVLPRLGLLTAGLTIALLNAAACAVLLAGQRTRRSLRPAAALAGVCVLLALAFHHADAIDQHFLKKFYYSLSHEDYESTSRAVLIGTDTRHPEVERHRSPYQMIDIVRHPHPDQHFFSLVSRKSEVEPYYPLDVRLYLNRDYQFFSGMDEFYHEWFVHVPIQVVGTVPRRVLVLGGGDGLVVRELRSYHTIERIVQVELDPIMLRLALEHPLISVMNGGVYGDARVEVLQADAFAWLRQGSTTFDAVFVDMPFPRNYGLSKVYSREFYALIRRRLAANGFLAMDAPGAWCGGDQTTWLTYYNTLRAAGFPRVEKLTSRVNLESARIKDALRRALLEEPGADGADGDEIYARAHRALTLSMEEAAQDFILAFPVEREPHDTRWHDFGLPLYAFGPEHLALAFENECAKREEPGLVNTIFRPTLPRLSVARVELP